jgi:8-oxo-dGTP diphosphatase
MDDFRPDIPSDRVALALLVVAAALVDAQGRVLMQQRPAAREHGSLWEFPGGKLEPGEGPVAALLRELQEELAIAVAPEALVPLGFAASEAHDGARSVILLLYGCRRWDGTPVSQEGATCAWVRPDSLAALPMPPLDVPLAGLAGRFAGAQA